MVYLELDNLNPKNLGRKVLCSNPSECSESLKVKPT
jgi:hypothetical protein